MVLLNDKKYACETCIKGHRSSACKHTDRPLYEIKKKGRPVTQCEHCRELRKTKQVHVKCLCGQDPNGSPGEASSKKGAVKLPAVAAFPHGLPEDLEALAILPAVSDGSIDSDHSGETSPSGCRCRKNGVCDCAVPRKPTGRRRLSNHDMGKGDRHHPELSPLTPNEPTPPLSSHVIARIAELRPVLPRPTRNHQVEGPIHDPSLSTPHAHSSRHHMHGDMYFSPYERAYGQTHYPSHVSHERKPMTPGGDTRLSTRSTLIQQPDITGIPFAADSWFSVNGESPSACACGDSCRCPGCPQHNNGVVPAMNTYATCTNPPNCLFCLDCTILSFSVNNNTPSAVDATPDVQSRELEEWLRQFSSMTTAANSVGMQSTINPYDLLVNQMSSFPNAGEDAARQARPGTENRCSSPRGLCSCPIDGCHCNQQGTEGCRSRTTFAVSGERGISCDKRFTLSNAAMASRPPRIPDYIMMTNIRNGAVVGIEDGSFLSMSEVPSRSSSSSSTSSRAHMPSPIKEPTSSAPVRNASQPPSATINYCALGQSQLPPRQGQYDVFTPISF